MKKGFRWSLILAIVMIFSLITVSQATGRLGSKEDPIVTLSYLELKVAQLKDYIDQKSFSSNNPDSGGPIHSLTFEVVELGKGQSLIAGASTEIILRSGEAAAIVSPLGGLTDITSGKDLQASERILSNHLLIVPRDDGRGVFALSDCFLLVKGGYTIK